MSDQIDEHRTYLSDEPRLQAYSKAIASVVKKGDVFVDLGAGTGIWGLFAARQGARRVYSLEATSLVQKTQEIADANPLGAEVSCLQVLSTEVALEESADVVCCDQIGRFGFEAGVFTYFADAAKRLAKADASYIPSHIEFHAAPVRQASMAASVRFWRSPVHGFDVSAMSPIAENSGYPCTLEPDQLASKPAMLARQETTNPNSFRGTGNYAIEEDSEIDGFGCWFRAELAPDIFVTNSPLCDQRVKRKNVFLPLAEPLALKAGDTLSLTCHFIPAETVLSWKVVHQRGDTRKTYQHSTFCGLFLAKDDLRRTAPSFQPRLTDRGNARKCVLDLCDGERSLKSIEDTLFSEFHFLFQDRSEAACFVAEVVTRYSE